MSSELSDDRLLNRAEVHTHFGITQRYLETSVGRGEGPPMIKIGRSCRYRVGDLREWIASLRVPAKSGEDQEWQGKPRRD